MRGSDEKCDTAILRNGKGLVCIRLPRAAPLARVRAVGRRGRACVCTHVHQSMRSMFRCVGFCYKHGIASDVCRAYVFLWLLIFVVCFCCCFF